MDASLLMSPDYVSPLLPSELHILVEQLFEPDNIAWLRHSAVKKFLAWRRSHLDAGLGLGDGESMHMNAANQARTSSSMGPTSLSSMHSSTLSTPSPSQVLVPRFPRNNALHNPNANLADLSLSSLTATSSSPYTRARLQDHQYREERLAQLHLAKWAQHLQTELRDEKRRFETLVRGERARWLLERVGDEVRAGNVTAADAAAANVNSEFDADESVKRPKWPLLRHHTYSRSRKADADAESSEKVERRNLYASWATRGRYRASPSSSSAAVDSRDPLGLCGVGDGLRRGAFMVVRVLGSMGLVGAVAVAVVRAWSGQSVAQILGVQFAGWEAGWWGGQE